MDHLVSLIDYFQPLNFTTVLWYLFFLLFFDVVGTFTLGYVIRHKDGDGSRILNWLAGLGVFVFVWFILRFFIPPRDIYITVSLVVLLFVSLPPYIHSGEYHAFPVLLRKLIFPLLIILPLLPAVFVKASLPPYYSDEMAYQFISPSNLVDLGTWNFVDKFYDNLPRVFNYLFTLTFSLTKTFSVVRLIHFSILVTAVSYGFLKIREHFKLLSGVLFVLIFFSLANSIVLSSTVGFVDVATFSFILIGAVSALDFFLSESHGSVVLSGVFWAMALGTKYTVITSALSFWVSFVGLAILFKKNLLKKVFTKRFIFKITLITLFFGGYWYIKNLIAFGNPIYPFFFPCYRYSELCNLQSASFFGGWTTNVNFANLPAILFSLLPGSPKLLLFLALIPFLIMLNNNKKARFVSVLLILAGFTELLIIKYVSGFYTRYHQHLQLYFVMLIAVQFANAYKSKVFSLGVKAVCLILIYLTLGRYIDVIKATYGPNFISPQEINYSLGKMNIHDWIRWKFPMMSSVVDWCENPPEGKRTPVVRLDPDMIWFADEGFFRSFMTNCYIDEKPALDKIPLENVLAEARNRKIKFWTVSINKCIPDSEVKIKRHEEVGDDRMIYLRRLNNIIICNSLEVEPNIFYFDYSKLKDGEL
jgi:hypothetical protein